MHGAYVSDAQIAAILEPYRASVKPLDLPLIKTEDEGAKPEVKKTKSWWRCLWNFWLSLRQKDRKLIINGFFWLLGLLTGKQVAKPTAIGRKRR